MAPKPKAKVSSTRAAARSSKQATKSKKAKQPSPTPPSAEEDSGVEVGDEETDSSEDEFLIVAKKLSEITKKKNTAQRKQHEAALLKVAGTLEKEIQAAFNDVERQASLLTLVEKLEVLVEKRNAIENKILDKSEQLEKVVKHAVDELTEVFDGRLKDLAKLKLGEHPLEPLKEPIVNASQDEEPLDPVFAEMLSKLRHGQ